MAQSDVIVKGGLCDCEICRWRRELARKAEKSMVKTRVEITVEGGVIQEVEKPDSVEVEVLDFDIEGASEEDPQLRENEKGEKYLFSVW